MDGDSLQISMLPPEGYSSSLALKSMIFLLTKKHKHHKYITAIIRTHPEYIFKKIIPNIDGVYIANGFYLIYI